jgi:hypothetical protein
VDAQQVLAFRLARSGLAARDSGSLAEAAACPISDFAREAALLALSARHEGLTRKGYDSAVDDGGIVLAHAPRGAIHALAPGDVELYGCALIATSDDELGAQLGNQVRRLAAEKHFAPTDALDEVAGATSAALADGRALGKNELHEELRARVDADLMPWCRGCGSNHVAPMLWRYATVRAGARLDSERRYVLRAGDGVPGGAEAVLRFLSFYGPAGSAEFAEWAGVARAHARRLWVDARDGLTEVEVDGRRAWARPEDLDELESPPSASGVRLIPPGDPYLQKPNRSLLAPDAALSKRLFRPVASPGAVLRDGALAGLWRAKAKGRKLEISVEKLGRIPRSELQEEAKRVATLRGAAEPVLRVE